MQPLGRRVMDSLWQILDSALLGELGSSGSEAASEARCGGSLGAGSAGLSPLQPRRLDPRSPQLLTGASLPRRASARTDTRGSRRPLRSIRFLPLLFVCLVGFPPPSS